MGKRRVPSGIVLTRWGMGWWTFIIFLFLYAPIIYLAVYSFNDSNPLQGIDWRGFTFKWYVKLAGNEVLKSALSISLIIAVLTTALSTVMGTLGAWLFYRYRYPMQRLISLLTFVPLAVPEVLLGASLLVLFVQFSRILVMVGLPPIELGMITVIISHSTFCFPFVLIGVAARLESIDPSLEEAALDLGARPGQAFWLVIMPYLMPAIVAGALMSFTLSLDEYLVTAFTAGADSQTLPLKIYGMVKKGLNFELNALSTVLVVVTIALVTASELLKPKPAKR